MALVITDDATPDQIREAIGHMRAKQRACRDQQVRIELGEGIDELLDALGSGSL